MIAIKFLALVALGASVTATPVASAPDAATTDWTALPIPDDWIDWTGVDKAAMKNPANWNSSASSDKVEAAPGKELIVQSGPCSQGTCPDFHAAFDLVYTFTAVPVPGDPPLTIFSSDSDIRVNDCDKCLRHKVGSSLGNSVPGGCYNFKTCGRDQVICVDPDKYRAHRIWKDNGHKTCYNMKVDRLGDCGFIKTRIVIHPTGETACTW
ncbi:uncharacterized protein E0L32_010215 [Thyridium curvatum]|uniref:Uncharacterized protein n=1 Tax=Thyridium curvatum TaxID=1093900 RepID=A0A507ATF0_9PEZI|nr:uncharacterized protein E0L32_010215 [Thyridium curvatum]TPX08148.1 hypothetical protein E0L32_010215 [Thyridium curvatum]